MEKAGIDLRRLRYFIAVCEHGGFSRASSSIGIAQPALTRQIKLLEKEIGFSLINRSGRGAEPTEEGRFLLTRSRRYLNGLDEIVQELKHRSSTLRGEVVLGICPTIAPFLLPDLVLHLHGNYPGLTLSVIEAYSGDLQNLVAQNKLDLSLTYRANARLEGDAVALFSERLVLVTAPSPTTDRHPRTLAEIARMKLVLPSAIHELRRIIDRVCDSRQVTLKPELELDSLDAVKSVLIGEATPCSTILPYHSVKREVDDGQLSSFDIDESQMQRTIAVVRPKSARNFQVSTVLVDYLVQRAAALKAKHDTLF
ncbi:MAG TPA: LysR family transcriptional regulator [Hypericibacter adhaerens]|uniref:LysR family transcriptional regulator n=1 Tax=Hypericibacter adhaerens TaxID=2602016 RepID=UPI002C480C76|nr:LysR family transcriptional regulator [Hypericibacter adhaerens]HWA41614.1 LysR family transcriptional regulator [Hypericibacter adhaerens]